jgi:hypothetical protein
LCESPFNDPVEGVEEPVNVGRLCWINNDHQGVIVKAGLGGSNHSAPLRFRSSAIRCNSLPIHWAAASS